MKKFICMLSVLLCSVMNLSAQDINLEGRWVAQESEGDNQGSLIFLFEGNELTQAVYAEANTPEVGVVGVMVATPPAPFKLEGNKLTVTRDPSQAEFQIMKTEYNDQVKELISSSPDMEEKVKELLEAGFEKQKVDMAENVLYDGDLEIISCNDGELKLKDPEGDELTFYLKGE